MILNSYRNQPVSSENRMKDVLVEIRLAQRACQINAYQYMVPGIFKGMSVDAIQNHQRSLITEMRSLNKHFSDEQFKKIEERAENEAQILIETTSDVGLGDAIRGVASSFKTALN